MRPLLVLTGLVSAAVFCGGLLAYPVQLCIAPFTEVGLPRIASLCALACGLGLGLIWLARREPVSLHVLGLARDSFATPRAIAFAFGAGAAIVALHGGVLLVSGVYQIDPGRALSTAALLTACAKALVIGALVGTIEELVFRGVLFRAVQVHSGTRGALLLSSLVYTAVHFIRFTVPVAAPGWLSGIQMATQAFSGIADAANLDSTGSLFLLGLLLGLIRERSGGIGCCIGLHAGIVTMLKIFTYMTDYAADTPYDFLVNTVNHQLGVVASLWLGAATLVYWARGARRG